MTIHFRWLADALVDVLSTKWPELAENIGLWIPVEVINKEHDDKPDGEEEFGKDLFLPCDSKKSI